MSGLVEGYRALFCQTMEAAPKTRTDSHEFFAGVIESDTISGPNPRFSFSSQFANMLRSC